MRITQIPIFTYSDHRGSGYIGYLKMTSPKGRMNFFGKEFENVHNWSKRLEMAFEVQGYDEVKLFKIVKLKSMG
jgi:hypothetical protein